MDVKYINPFIEAFNNVMPELGFGGVDIGGLGVKSKDFIGSGVIVLVGIVGAIRGNVVYTMSTQAAKKIAAIMMMEEWVEELDETAMSALSELTNMLTAHAATAFSKMGVAIDISTPTMLQGDNVSISMNSNEVLCVKLIADGVPVETNISFEN